MKNKKTALLKSGLAMLLALSMLVGSTFAWFTDSVTSKGNVITAGKLDVEMYWTDDLNSGVWHNVEEDGYNTIFSYDKWEPGYTDVKYIKLVNNGNLALNYKLTLTPENGVGKLAEVINVYFADEAVEMNGREDLDKLGAIGLLNNVLNGGATANGTLLAEGQQSPLHPTKETVMTLAMTMITTAGNEYQEEDAGDFTITALATQAAFEEDSFGSNYDGSAEYPQIISGGSVTATFNPDNGKVPAGGVNLQGDGIAAYAPAGVALKNGADSLKLSVTPLKNTTSDITVVNNEILIPVDVHIDGVAEDNTTPIIVDLGEVLPKYLNMGNYHLYHVEDGVNSVMTLVNSRDALTVHNTYTYDPMTGAVSVAMASFSEVALVADTSAGWKGKFDYTWYDASKTALTIANADQLAAFGAIVGGMDGQTKDNFENKTVKLLSDINLGDNEGANPDVIFYPIGYYNNTGSYVRTNGSITSSVSAFKGTFDGNGHTIANFYQNTWEMFGDYNDGYSSGSNYYKDAMGLFGYVYGGTVKNLTVDSFSSDGEFTPTGVIAAYAVNSTFENIAITKCNPRVYNTGNGGIVGIGGNSDDPDTYKLTFNNITIDNTNKITALWGSWDVACGGLVGMFRGAGHVNMTNCHVAAQIDVYNDVCGNYQYYWYRYSGMMVGTNKNMVTDDDGYTVPETTKFHAKACTVHFGEWNDYYYCELVANTLASYTHDHQFSRLEQIASLDEIKSGNTWTKTGNFLLISGDTKTCYHIVKGSDGTLKQHLHTDAGEETVNGKTVLKEDKQIVYLPFNQLFTGYGWGVKHIPVYNGEDYAFEGITILDREVADSVEKFETKFTGDFLYRVGNKNAVSVGSLFAAIEGADIKSDKVLVTISKLDESYIVDGTFTADTTDWTQGTIQFTGTGVVEVTIQDYYFCKPTTIKLEVIDAKNITKVESATTNDVVLLNDISGSFAVSNGHTFYGNDFTVTLPTNSVQEKGQGFTGYISIGAAQDSGAVSGGNLDNVRIVGPVYPEMYLYRSQAEITDKNDPDYGTGDNMRYFRNSVIVYGGNCTISNSYISGCRTALCLRGGNNVVIESTTLSGGSVANMQVAGVNTLVLRDLITTDGLGVYVDSSAANITVEGNLNQYNWTTKEEWTTAIGGSVNAKFFPDFFSEKNDTYKRFQHVRDNETYVNMAFIFACDWDSDKLNNDNQINKDIYSKQDKVSVSTPNGDVAGGVYSVSGQELTDELYVSPIYMTNGFNPIAPTFSFDNTPNHDDDDTDNTGDTYCVYNEGSGTLKIGVTGDSKTLDLSNVSVVKNGSVLAHTTYLNGTQIHSDSVAIKAADGAKQMLTFKATSNDAGYDKDGKPIAGSTEYTWNITVDVAVLAYPKPEWNMGGDYQFDITNCVYAYYGTSNGYGEAVPIYEGIKINYYDKTGKFVKLDLSGTTTHPTGSNNANSNAFTYTLSDGSTLTMKFSSGWKSGATTHQFTTYNNKVYIYPQSLDNDNYIRAKVGNQDFDVKISYTFTDPNGQSITQTMQWYNAKANNSKVTTVQWKDFDSTNGKKPSTCITPDTLITLADGSQVRVDELKGNEELLVWNHQTGKLEKAPVAYIVDHNGVIEKREVITLNFSNGNSIKIIGEHVFYDATVNKYVALDTDAADYIGHEFLGLSNDGVEKTELVSVEKDVYETAIYEVVSYKHLTCFTDGMLSTSAYLDQLLNVFDVDADTFAYDMESAVRDIETYGLYTYADFEGLISEEAFELYDAQYLKIAVGKGYITWDDIHALIDIYFNVEVEPLH